MHKQTYVYVKALLTIRSMQVVPHVVNWYLAADRIPNTWFGTNLKTFGQMENDRLALAERKQASIRFVFCHKKQ